MGAWTPHADVRFARRTQQSTPTEQPAADEAKPFTTCNSNTTSPDGSLLRCSKSFSPRSMFNDSPAGGRITAPHELATMSSTSPSELGANSITSLSLLERILVRVPESNIVTVSGGLAGAASGVVSCPLDVIKTKLQAQGGFRSSRAKESPALSSATYNGVKGTARTIWREDGIRGLYRGLGPMLLGYVPTWAVYLTVYDMAQRFFNTKTGKLRVPDGTI